MEELFTTISNQWKILASFISECRLAQNSPERNNRIVNQTKQDCLPKFQWGKK